jgi:hypothetical protein
MNIIAKAKGLLVEPGKTWEAIAAEPMTLGGVFAGYVLPLAAIPSIASAIGTYLSGNQPNFPELAISYAIALLSVLIMLVILGTLAAIFWKLRNQPRPTWAEYFRVDAPFSLYFGWITAATLVNFGALCFERGMWPLGLSMDEWALVTVCLASGIYAITTTVTRDAVFGGVFVWASLGIATKAAGITMSVQLAAASGIVVVLACIARAAIARRERPRYA